MNTAVILPQSMIPGHLKKYFEESPLCGECYVCHMVEVFRGVWNVLRDDGTVWLNLGDSYSTSMVGEARGKPYNRHVAQKQNNWVDTKLESRKSHIGNIYGIPRENSLSLRPKNLIGIPHRVALALQTDGWIWRKTIVWAKPNPMPESATDRPTSSHEYVFLLAKAPRYFYDAVAIQEPIMSRPKERTKKNGESSVDAKRRGYDNACGTHKSGRNKRDVWHIATTGFPDVHFAVFPRALVEPCILAGTSAHGVCSGCGAPYERVVEHHVHRLRRSRDAEFDTLNYAHGKDGRAGERKISADFTLGWLPACTCTDAPRRPAVVLDPFGGSGTVLAVAKEHDRSAISIELKAEYLPLQQKRLRDEPSHQFQFFT